MALTRYAKDAVYCYTSTGLKVINTQTLYRHTVAALKYKYGGDVGVGMGILTGITKIYMNNNTGENNTGYRNSGDWNSGCWNSGHGNSVDRNSGDWNSGCWNSGHGNSGDWNSGDWNSGYFNTNAPDKIRVFNTWVEMTHEEFNKKYNVYADIPLNHWVASNDMTDEEKKSVKAWEQMGGYLKTIPFKEACQVWWKENPSEHKRFLKLPAFNAAIFEEITGIKVDDKKHELLTKADELIAKANELKAQAKEL